MASALHVEDDEVRENLMHSGSQAYGAIEKQPLSQDVQLPLPPLPFG